MNGRNTLPIDKSFVACRGAKVVVAGSAYGEMAMHFIEKYGMMALRLPSKFDMRRFCRYCGLILKQCHVYSYSAHVLQLAQLQAGSI